MTPVRGLVLAREGGTFRVATADGEVAAVLRGKAKRDRYDRVVEPYGFIILIVLMMSGVLSYIISPITNWVIDTLFRLVR